MELTRNLSPTLAGRASFPGLAPVVPVLPPLGELTVQVLRTAAERQRIASLRRYADCGSEYELDPGMAALEKKKDSIGTVMAICREGEPIATIRVIPSGHGVTLTERYWAHLARGTALFAPTSWELGRLVIAPEHRRADLFPRCMALAMNEFVEHEDVEHFHGSCLMRMTRLYRRFGFTIVGSSASVGGKECALIHARVTDVARALKVPVHAPAAVLQ
jgi:predicted GNAT family N-acyltransferase